MDTELKHSGMGIASFVLSILTGILTFLLFLAAGVLQATTPGGLDQSSPAAIGVGLGIMLFGLVDLVALILGIAGLVQRDRKKIFAGLGLGFSIAILLAVGAVIALGVSSA